MESEPAFLIKMEEIQNDSSSNLELEPQQNSYESEPEPKDESSLLRKYGISKQLVISVDRHSAPCNFQNPHALVKQNLRRESVDSKSGDSEISELLRLHGVTDQVVIKLAKLRFNSNGEEVYCSDANNDSDDSANPYKCKVCSRKYKLQDQLIDHLLIHSKGRIFVCPVSGCKFNCYQADLLQSHTVSTHCNETDKRTKGPFKCLVCGWSSRLNQLLKKHMQQVHNSQGSTHNYHKPIQTTLKARKNKIQKTAVRRLTNSTLSPFSCAFCGKIFLEQAKIIIHVRDHMRERDLMHVTAVRTSAKVNAWNKRNSKKDKVIRNKLVSKLLFTPTTSATTVKSKTETAIKQLSPKSGATFNSIRQLKLQQRPTPISSKRKLHSAHAPVTKLPSTNNSTVSSSDSSCSGSSRDAAIQCNIFDEDAILMAQFQSSLISTALFGSPGFPPDLVLNPLSLNNSKTVGTNNAQSISPLSEQSTSTETSANNALQTDNPINTDSSTLLRTPSKFARALKNHNMYEIVGRRVNSDSSISYQVIWRQPIVQAPHGPTPLDFDEEIQRLLASDAKQSTENVICKNKTETDQLQEEALHLAKVTPQNNPKQFKKRKSRPLRKSIRSVLNQNRDRNRKCKIKCITNKKK